jgi:hypothetical protein
MVERSVVAHEPASEAVATTGLLLNFTSVIAAAISLASWGASGSALAGTAVLVAFLAFIASIICFGKQTS